MDGYQPDNNYLIIESSSSFLIFVSAMNGFAGTDESHDINEDQHSQNSQYDDHYSSTSDDDNKALEVCHIVDLNQVS